MHMELIQPFINSADAVLGDGLESSVSIENLAMDENAYRRHGIAAEICLTGDIEGRIIFDAGQKTAACFARHLAGSEVPHTEEAFREAVCELANQVIGNAVTVLNDQGFSFRVHPPTIHSSEQGSKSSEDTEAMVMAFNTEFGIVFMNIALRYHHRPLQRTAGAQ